jgi:purine nucleoside permease
MKKLSTLKLIHKILTDKRNASRYCMTQMRDKKTLEVTATYDDAIQLIEDMIVAEIGG